MIVYGVRRKNSVMGQVEDSCKKCQKSTMHTVIQSSRRMTLFFIPLFPLGTQFASRCNVCGRQARVKKAQADQWFPKQPADQPQAANPS